MMLMRSEGKREMLRTQRVVFVCTPSLSGGILPENNLALMG
jgi:hypothetical protein